MCSIDNDVVKCRCKSGYVGNGETCFDLNECALGAHECDYNADCHNTLGSYNCQCKPGYEGDGIQICAVSDECLLGEHLCHVKALCTDLDDQYRCDCLSGFKGTEEVFCLKINFY